MNKATVTDESGETTLTPEICDPVLSTTLHGRWLIAGVALVVAFLFGVAVGRAGQPASALLPEQCVYAGLQVPVGARAPNGQRCFVAANDEPEFAPPAAYSREH